MESTGYKDRLVAIYTKYNPEKLPDVDEILEKFKGKEEDMFATLVGKYGPEPEADAVNIKHATNTHSLLPDFVGIANFAASSTSSTTPHRTLLRPVFLQYIHRFASTTFESPITFKNVTSSWEDAMLNHSDILFCWTILQRLIGLPSLVNKMERLVHTLTKLDGSDKGRYTDPVPLQHIDADPLLSAAIRWVGPNRSAETVERIFRISQYKYYDVDKYFSTFHYYLMSKFRETLSPDVIVMFFKIFSAFSQKGRHVDLISENLRGIGEYMFDDHHVVVDVLHKQRIFSALITVAASSRLSTLTSPVSSQNDEEEKVEGSSSKEERVDKILFSRLTSWFYSHPEIQSPSSIVQYFELIKKHATEELSTSLSSSSAAVSSTDRNKDGQVDNYRRQLLFFKDGTLVFRSLLACAVETETIEKYLEIVQQEDGASEILLQEIENTADDNNKNIFVCCFERCKCIDADRFKLLMTFLQKSSSSSSKQLLSGLLRIEKTDEDSATTEKEQKKEVVGLLLGPQFLFRELCQNKNLTFSGFKSFVDTLREMNLLEDFLLQAVVRGIPQDINNTTTAASYCVSLLFNCQSLETVQYFFEHFCSNNKTIIKKLLSPKYLLFFVCKDMDDRNKVVFACDLMCEYGFFDEQYEDAIAKGKIMNPSMSFANRKYSEGDFTDRGMSRHHARFWELRILKKRDEEKDIQIAELKEDNARLHKRVDEELALIKAKLGM